MLKKDLIVNSFRYFIFAFVFAVSFSNAETLILQQGYNSYAGMTDTWLNSANVWANYGNSVKLFVRPNNSENTLLKFDVSTLPHGAVISSAILKLYQFADYGTPTKCSIDLWRMNRSWKEGTGPEAGGSFYDYGGASWYYYEDSWSADWTARPNGGYGATGNGDHDTSPSASSEWVGTGTYSNLTNPGWRTFDVTDDVQAWSQGIDNYGWLLTMNSGSRPVFYSSENSSLCPILEINYSIDPNHVFDSGIAVLQDGLNGYTGTTDTWLNSAQVWNNYGAGSQLFVRTGTMEDTLLRFDLSSLEGVIIVSARLELYQFADYGTPSECKVDLWRMKRSWKEGTGSDAGASFYDFGGASWWYYEDSWSADWTLRPDGGYGATGIGDRGSSLTASGSWIGTGTYGSLTNPGWRTFDVTNDVQAWISGETNWGWLLTLSSGSRPVFYSRNQTTNSTLRPILRIQYEINPNVLVLQNGKRGYNGTTDTWLNPSLQWSNYGASSKLFVRTPDRPENTLIKFDMPQIAGATINSATLKLYQFADYGTPSECNVDVWRMKRSWKAGRGPTDLGYSFYDYGGACWYYYEDSWSADWTLRANGAYGGTGIGDRGSSPTASGSWVNTGSYGTLTNPGWQTFDVTNDVQAWASGESNWGWQLTLASGSRPVFYSSDPTVDPALRPILIVDLTPGSSSGSSDKVDVTENFENYIVDVNLWFEEPEASAWHQIGPDVATISSIPVASNNTKKLKQCNWKYNLWYAMDFPAAYNVNDPINQAEPLIVTADVAISGTLHGSWPFANHIMVGKVALGISGDDIAYGIVEPGDSTRIATVSLLEHADQIEANKWYEVKIVYHQVPGTNNDTADLYYRIKGMSTWIEVITDYPTTTDLSSDLHVYTIGDFGDSNLNVGYIDNIDVRYPTERPTFCGDDNTYYIEADINKDCYVNFKDVEQMCIQWLY